MKSILFLLTCASLAFTTTTLLGQTSESLYTITEGESYWTQDFEFGDSVQYIDEHTQDNQGQNNGRVYYVRQNNRSHNQNGLSWKNAFSHPQQALAIAEQHDQVWVAEGVYTPRSSAQGPISHLSRDASFIIPPGVGLYGGFLGTESSLQERAGSAEQTILSGELQNDGDPTNNSKRIVFFDSDLSGPLTPYAVIDGFQVTGGYNDSHAGSGLSAFDSQGPWFQGSKLHIQNMIFDNNTSTTGGAVHLFLFGGNITDSIFRHNTALLNGGALAMNVYWGHNKHISNCLFIDNHAGTSGGAIHRVGGSPNNSNHWLINSSFIANSANRGGAISYSSHGTDNLPGRPWSFGNILFAHNQAKEGAALWVAPGAIISSSGGNASIAPSRVLARNITVSQNNGDSSLFMRQHDSLTRLNATLDLKNSIVWNNYSQNSISGDLNAFVSILDSTQYQGLLVSYDDPRFVDPANLDFHLSQTSPGLRTGYWGFLPVDIFDLDQDGDITEFLASDIEGRNRFSSENDFYQTVEVGAYAFRSGIFTSQRMPVPQP